MRDTRCFYLALFKLGLFYMKIIKEVCVSLNGLLTPKNNFLTPLNKSTEINTFLKRNLV